MNTVAVQSYDELKRLVSQNERSFLLLYKRGSDQSECALERISAINDSSVSGVAVADVASVRDIHGKLGVDTAPSLVLFRKGQVVNIVRGCQTSQAYTSLLTGREMGRGAQQEGKPVKRVTVYTTPTCSWCTTLKTYLDQNKIHYREVNVAADSAAAEDMVRKSGKQGVPQTEINGQMIVGFDKPGINRLLGINP